MACSKLGYIYIRNHWSYQNYRKVGETHNIPDRDSCYITGEHKRGYFEVVYEVPYYQRKTIERLLQIEFKHLNDKYDGGTEFFKQDILYLIEPFFKEKRIKYKKLTPSEIDKLLRPNRIKNTIKKINVKSLIHALKTNNKIINYIPRDDQKLIIDKLLIHFQNNSKGLLVLICGIGKTLISLWITQKLNCNRIIIGVPNILLLKQWKKIILSLFVNINYLIVSSGINENDIIHFLQNNTNKCIIITTYSSSHKVLSATNKIKFKFNMKLNDEVHHLTSNNPDENERKTYINMLKIECDKQLSLTATLKVLESCNQQLRDEDIIISNDNINVFGEIIDRKCLLWAIDNNIICDYIIQTIITDEEQLDEHLDKFNITDDNDKRLFLSAFASLKSIFDNHSHHLLIYSNNTENSKKIIKFIKLLIDNNYFVIANILIANYDSTINVNEQNKIIDNFQKSKYGILSCVFCLGEGFDDPNIDAVVFAENMSSNIRIVQSFLRAGRKNIKEPNKITKIILPLLNKNDWLNNDDNSDLKKIREVIYQIGLEDETVEQKIRVSKIEIRKQDNKKQIEKKNIIDDLGEYNEDLTKQLKLKTVKKIALGITYEKAKKIIIEKNIRNKEDYYKLCEKDNRLSTEPDIIFKGQFKGWIDYLGIQKDYYDLDTCKIKVNEYITKYPEIKTNYLELSLISSELSKIDKLFPPDGLWVEYYNIKDLRDIITIKSTKKKSGVII
jgi:superfamily II DNA or RNA helicase